MLCRTDGGFMELYFYAAGWMLLLDGHWIDVARSISIRHVVVALTSLPSCVQAEQAFALHD